MEMRGEEKELWELVRPYIVNHRLREDAPQEIKRAYDRLYEIAWDPSRGQ